MLNPILMLLNSIIAAILGAIAVMLPPSTATARATTRQTRIQTPSSDVPLVTQRVRQEDDSPLESVSWQLSHSNSNPLNPQLPAIQLEFAPDSVSGSAGCNTYFSDINHGQGQQLQFGAIASTRRACEPSLMDRETQYLQALAGVQKYSFDPNGNLWLAYQTTSGTGTLEFSPIHNAP